MCGFCAQSTPIDQAAWLLSRAAAFQLDLHDRADELLALAGEFGTTEAAPPEPAPFVGSRRCAECHPRIAREQQRESRHAQTLRFGVDLKQAPLPAKPVSDPVIPSITHAFSRKSDDRIEAETRDADHIFRALYYMPSGLVGTGSPCSPATIRASIASYAYRTGLDQSWGKPRASTLPLVMAETTSGSASVEKRLTHCLSCHTAGFRSVTPRPPRRPADPDEDRRWLRRCRGREKPCGSRIRRSWDWPSPSRQNSCAGAAQVVSSVMPPTGRSSRG